MADALKQFFSQPIVIGLSIGLVVTLIVWIRSLLKSQAIKTAASREAFKLKGEIENLRRHIQTQMEINAKGNEALWRELKELKEINGNLSQTIGVLKQKPGRAEIRTLHLYHKAIRIMNSRAPGFGPVWETALQDAEMEVKKEESGLLGWIRKPFLLKKAEAELSPRAEDEPKD